MSDRPDRVGFDMKPSALNQFLRPHVAEFSGTFVLVFAGCAAITVGKLSPEEMALTFALVIATMVYTFGHISGGHNPAISIGLATGGHQSWARAAALAIGGAIALGGLVAGPVSGGSLNLARSLVPALIVGDFTNLWLYIVAPIGVVAALTYRHLRGGAAAA